ncbi:ROK family protein [Fundicoccus culcitae]|uniref:fructokinase n=1 Tax=Fundicoccus culcitae TaxID=2969821 RepID=A0ABY5P466_9LACT|nr:ROK family protein [Fundicoccus culcitae]UUX33527.1 ROK family protein [Fundicoccus culcitae]
MLGAIEAGGTKFVCAVGDHDFKIIEKVSFPTTNPQETMQYVFNFFDKYKKALEGISIGSFGPIDIDKNSETYGFITNTPKIGWKNYNFLGEILLRYNLPTYWTTDVNASVYGEYVLGSGKNLKNIVYYTIGTGVGGGVIYDGKLIEGYSHLELGHQLVNRHAKDKYSGNCMFHENCLEGMASGPSIENRFGIKGNNLDATDNFWDIEAYYIAQSAYNSTLFYAPEAIIYGGGVMKQDHLIKKVKKEFVKLLNGYRPIPSIDDYILSPKLGDEAAIIGCLALAKKLIVQE